MQWKPSSILCNRDARAAFAVLWSNSLSALILLKIISLDAEQLAALVALMNSLLTVLMYTTEKNVGQANR